MSNVSSPVGYAIDAASAPLSVMMPTFPSSTACICGFIQAGLCSIQAWTRHLWGLYWIFDLLEVRISCWMFFEQQCCIAIEAEYVESARQQVDKVRQLKLQVSSMLKEMSSRPAGNWFVGFNQCITIVEGTSDTGLDVGEEEEDDPNGGTPHSYLLASSVIAKKFTVIMFISALTIRWIFSVIDEGMAS